MKKVLKMRSKLENIIKKDMVRFTWSKGCGNTNHMWEGIVFYRCKVKKSKGITGNRAMIKQTYKPYNFFYF